MAHQFISELRAGMVLRQFFLLRRVEHRQTKDGDPFLDVELADRSGSIRGKVWKETLQKCPAPLSPCEFVAVKGTVETYRDQPPQINIQFIDTVTRLRARGRPLEDFDPDCLIPATPRDRQEMWQELLELARSRINPPLRELVLSLLEAHQQAWLEWPGAESYHHAYRGGLLEHTLTVAQHACRALEVYPELKADLVLAGAILHDIGKIRELTGPPCFQRTAAGGLLGHIVLGWEMVREQARILEFPQEQTLMALEHIIISHHGAEEFGSPILPRTPEALLVYYLDEIDSKLHMAQRHLEADGSEGGFTSYHHVLKRRLFRPSPGDPSPLGPSHHPDP